MTTFYKKICAVAVILVFPFLYCCSASRMETTADPSLPEPAIRLPYGTAPLMVERITPPPPHDAAHSAAPIEAQEGMARSLRLFQINFGHTKTGPASTTETPDLPKTEP